MELVYLWVEEYKNIKEQGFNFSPRFDCNFDGENLIIDEKEDYVNIFPDNIDITAIVGENGSGKSSLLELLDGTNSKNINHFFLYQKDMTIHCIYTNTQPNIISNKGVKYIDDRNSFSDDEDTFYPKNLRIANSKKIGEDSLSHFYFGDYSGIYGGMNINRKNHYSMIEARFFVPRYINIHIDHVELFDRLKQIYKFDTLRLLLKNNSTSYIRRFIDKEIIEFRDQNLIEGNPYTGKVCIYEENEHILQRIREEYNQPITKIEIHLYERNREKIVSVLENIENIHRSQTYEDQIKMFNKYLEFDLAVLIAFIEYYLKNTEPCESCKIIHETLLLLEKEIKNNLMKFDHIRRITQNYIISFFTKLKAQNFEFAKDNLLSVDEIIEAIEYVQNFKVNYFDLEGNPYIDISIDEKLKDKLGYIKLMQKIFFEHDFDCGNEHFLRVFEYDLVNNKIGSNYETISDGEKHHIRISIDIIYYLKALKDSNYTPDKEDIAFFLADEPDNAMHPIWKKRIIDSLIEIFNNYSDIPNIKQHFIFTTHSPFMLSDLPKENVIFLKKYQKEDKEVKDDLLKFGNCKNASHNINIKQTFGANIHTLLSDGFFMNNGLMGEFAKSKIEEIKKFYELTKKFEEKNYLNKKTKLLLKDIFLEYRTNFRHIQSIIGEPFLQTIIKNYLDELEIIFNGKKQFLQNEIKKLQELESSL